MSTALAAPTAEQAARSHALDLACAHSRDLAVLLRDAAQSDQARPLKQKDRHALNQRAAEKLRQLQARLAEAVADDPAPARKPTTYARGEE